MKAGTAVFLLAEEAGRPVGVVIATNDGRKGWINRLAVSPDHRRRGIAAQLVRDVEARLQGAGIDVIAALIESHNQESLAFFRSLGYIHDERVEYVSTRRCGES